MSAAQAADFLQAVAPELFAGLATALPASLPSLKAPWPKPTAGEGAAALKSRQSEAERAEILAVLAASGGDRAKASERLGISRTTLWRKLKASEG